MNSMKRQKDMMPEDEPLPRSRSEGVVGLKSVNFSSLSSVVAADLDYCDVEWFALKMNRDHSVFFEIPPKY